MRISEITKYLETIAPLSLQEDYDNAGLITGDLNWELNGVMVCLDSTEAVLDEAIQKGCNLVLAHHPIIFRGLKSITGGSYIERTVIKAIQNNIAIYAIHTNLDNVLDRGVNWKIAERLGLANVKILAPKSNMLAIQNVKSGHIVKGPETSFQEMTAVLGERSQQVSYPVRELNPSVGSGIVGDLESPMSVLAFLDLLKERMNVSCVRHTELVKENVQRIAVCGGAGGFLLNAAKGSKADIFVTADYKYHEFFDADGKIIIADVGHYESEQYTIELLVSIISEKFSNFAPLKTSVNTNPVKYY